MKVASRKPAPLCDSVNRQKSHQNQGEAYYICSLPLDAKVFGNAVRSHWAIEISLHWALDVPLREDENRLRRGHAAENCSILRRLTLNLLKRETSTSKSQKAKRRCSGWDDDYREKVLFGRAL